jgi:hypothetical protein
MLGMRIRLPAGFTLTELYARTRARNDWNLMGEGPYAAEDRG